MIKIVKAKQQDIDSIMQLHIDSIIKGCSNCYSSEQIKEWINHKSKQKYLDSLNEIYILKTEEKVLGFIQIFENVIVRLFIDPTEFAKGYGTKLLNWGIKQIKKGGKYETVKVDSTLNAINFYKKHGFKPTGKKYNEKYGPVEIEFIKMIMRI